MQFCECGTLLVPNRLEDGTIMMKCPACGNTVNSESNAEAFEIKQVIRHSENEKMVVVDEEVNTMPIATVKCTKCGNNEAVYWQLQTRSADEASTTFYRCKKCKFTWRDYG
ncbi:MAG: transcription factor S [Candidatus Heimdallarchaeota archaeon]|nr:transcription factor S [Candidatus Heimdallarchaeota archaeon]